MTFQRTEKLDLKTQLAMISAKAQTPAKRSNGAKSPGIMKKLLTALTVAGSFALSAHASIFITEFSYQGYPFGEIEPEYIELTNLGDTPIDVTGWNFTDSGGILFSLSPLGVIAPLESVIITDISEADFRSIWTGLGAGVRILENKVDPGLGRNDSIIILDASSNIVDRLDYGDETFPESGRFRRISGVTLPGNLGQNDIYGWGFSDNAAMWQGVTMNNLVSINGDIGNPGYLNFVPVPEPGVTLLVTAGLVTFVVRSRFRRRAS